MELLAAILMVVLIVVLLALMAIFFLAFRVIVLWILVVVAPIAFALAILPNTKSIFDRWRKIFTGLLLVFPEMSLIFMAGVLGQKILTSHGVTTENGITQTMIDIIAMCLPILTLVAVPFVFKASIMSAAKLMGLGGALGKLSGVAGKARNKAGTNMKRHAGNTRLGQTVKKMNENSKAREAVRVARNGGEGRFFSGKHQNNLQRKIDMKKGGVQESLEKAAYQRAIDITNNKKASEAQKAAAYSTIQSYQDKKDKISQTMVASDSKSDDFGETLGNIKQNGANMDAGELKAWVEAGGNKANGLKDQASLFEAAMDAVQANQKLGADEKERLFSGLKGVFASSAVAKKTNTGFGDVNQIVEIAKSGQKVTKGDTYRLAIKKVGDMSNRELADGSFEKLTSGVSEVFDDPSAKQELATSYANNARRDLMSQNPGVSITPQQLQQKTTEDANEALHKAGKNANNALNDNTVADRLNPTRIGSLKKISQARGLND